MCRLQTVIPTIELSATETFQRSLKTEITAIKLRRYDLRKPTEQVEGGMPTIIDLNAEAAKLTMFRGRTPQTTFAERRGRDRKSTRLNSSHGYISYAVFCLKKKK